MKAKEFYKSTAWKWFSKYMKLKLSKNDFIIQCATSGKFYQLPDKRIHLGHYIKVFDTNNTHFATAFDEKNVLPQSYQDNNYSSGRPDIMRKKLIEMHGLNEIEKLEIKSKNYCNLGKFELQLISDEYRNKFNLLATQKGNPWK